MPRIAMVEGRLEVVDIGVRMSLDEARAFVWEQTGPHIPIRVARGATDDLADHLRSAIERFEAAMSLADDFTGLPSRGKQGQGGPPGIE